jgi:hypothetical protein
MIVMVGIGTGISVGVGIDDVGIRITTDIT